MKRLFLFLFLFFNMAYGVAGTIKWPVITSLEYIEEDDTMIRYQLNWHSIDVNTPSTSIGSCSISCKVSPYQVGSDFAMLGATWGTVALSYDTGNNITESRWIALSDAMIAVMGATGSRSISYYKSIGTECLGFGIYEVGYLSNIGSYVKDDLLHYLTTPTGTLDCIKPPPANEWCSLTTPSITFDYGTGSISNFRNNPTRTNNVNVECSSASDTGTKYVLKLAGNDSGELSLSNGMSAEFTADGKSLGETLVGYTGNNTVKIDSTLSGDPTDTGAFSGASILLVSYP